MPTLLDSYSEANKDSSYQIAAVDANKALGQCFTTPNDGISYKITSVKFYLAKNGTITGNATARLWAITGTYGTDAVPTGTVLATSDNFNVGAITGSFVLYELTFSGVNQYTMSPNTQYEIDLTYGGGSVGNEIEFGADSSSPTHGGNLTSQDLVDVWAGYSTIDGIFYVYGDNAAAAVSHNFGTLGVGS